MIPHHVFRPNTIKLALIANTNSISKDDPFLIARKVNLASLFHQEEGNNQNHGEYIYIYIYI